jgi:hypothetical protein
MLLIQAAHAEGFSFGLFGDTPYTQWERQHLPELMAEMDREELAFVIHDGDIKSGSSECSDKALPTSSGSLPTPRIRWSMCLVTTSGPTAIGAATADTSRWNA